MVEMIEMDVETTEANLTKKKVKEHDMNLAKSRLEMKSISDFVDPFIANGWSVETMLSLYKKTRQDTKLYTVHWTAKARAFFD